MNNTKTGGPAFPDGSTNEWGNAYNGGMTLRDYFAAKAMQGFCGNAANRDALPGEIAGGAYLVADAMMKAREA
jgi:hypothetical protein